MSKRILGWVGLIAAAALLVAARVALREQHWLLRTGVSFLAFFAICEMIAWVRQRRPA